MAESKTSTAGEVEVICPECGEGIQVVVTCTVLDADEPAEGLVMLDCKPDMANVWAHVWGHDSWGPDDA